MPVGNSGQEAAAAAVDELLDDEDEDEDEDEADDESGLLLLDPLSLEESLPDDDADWLAPAEDFESERASFR